MTAEASMRPDPAASPARAAGALVDEFAGEVRVTESEKLVTGRVWDIRRDRFTLDGHEIVRDYMDHTGAVAVLALDDAGRVLLIKQYRHPVAHRDWEIPAGLMDAPGETGLAAAQRELAEEADLQAGRWDLLLDLFLSPGGSSEAMRVFLARDLSPVEHDYVRTDEEAEIEPCWVDLDDAVTAVLEGRVHNAVTANAVLAAVAARGRDWATLRDATLPWTVREQVRGERSR